MGFSYFGAIHYWIRPYLPAGQYWLHVRADGEEMIQVLFRR